jgi:hypothetical protein
VVVEVSRISRSRAQGLIQKLVLEVAYVQYEQGMWTADTVLFLFPPCGQGGKEEKMDGLSWTEGCGRRVPTLASACCVRLGRPCPLWA